MPFLSRLLGPFKRDGTNSPAPPQPRTPSRSPIVVSPDFDHSLGYWNIARHDRDHLLQKIMPFMATSLQKHQLLSSFLGIHPWATDLIKPELELNGPDNLPEADNQDPFSSFPAFAPAFWLDPSTVTENVSQLVRLWFFTLLRYTYRRRLFERNGSDVVWQLDLALADLNSRRFYTALNDDDVRRLARRGAGFYRACCRHVKQRPAWTSFCDSVHRFCRAVGLHPSPSSSSNPERLLLQLRDNLTSIILHHNVSNQVARNTALVRKIARLVRKVEERTISSAAHHDEMKREIEEVTRRVEESSSHSPPIPIQSTQPNIDLTTELGELRAMQKRLDKTARDISRLQDTSSRQVQTSVDELQAEVDRLRIREDMYRTADLLDQIRWLLEYLPGKGVYGEGGHRWKQFWDKEWKKRKSNTHPLRGLVKDDQFYAHGKKLYDTLSKRLHNYGTQRGERLIPEVQRIVDAIRPENYDPDGKINLAGERDRWNV